MATRIDQVQEIRVRENTAPLLKFKLTTFRDLSSEDTAVNITGYAFRLRVWRFYIDANKERQVDEKFELTGSIVTAASGIFSFQLSTAGGHATIPPGQYFAEIVWNAAGDLTLVPTDGVTLRYIVERRGDNP